MRVGQRPDQQNLHLAAIMQRDPGRHLRHRVRNRDLYHAAALSHAGPQLHLHAAIDGSHPMRLLRFVRDSRGATAVEFGLLAPAFFAAVVGTFQVGALLWTQVGLQHATEMAARCASLDSRYSTKCNSATATQNYAATQALGLHVPSSI